MGKKRSKEKRRIPGSVDITGSDGVTRTRPVAQKGSGNPIGEFFASKGVRETIESVAIAFVLAFLFRTFEAEAFVIPTGSMAQTLMGRHKDLACEECGYEHMAGASEGNVSLYGDVVGSTCPICRHINRFEPGDGEQPYHTGDRIIVSKFVYDLSDPERWDVVVFKFPGNAKQNYIKRLVGKPGETLKIAGGDLWVKPLGANDDKYHIARKPPDKMKAVMQVVHDTNYVPKKLDDAGWPARWQPDSDDADSWQQVDQVVTRGKAEVIERGYEIENPPTDKPAWLRYHHYTPREGDWEQIAAGRPIEQPVEQLVTDFYAYNGFIHSAVHNRQDSPHESRDWQQADYQSAEALGMHWVGDLAFEADVEIQSADGTLLFDLVEAGRHLRCAIDVATGEATLSMTDIDGKALPFANDDGSEETSSVKGAAKVKGAGNHKLMFANFDNQLTLWVDGKVIGFDGPTTFIAPPLQQPQWNDEDDGDLAPAGIGSQGAKLKVDRLKLLRDVYYIAVKFPNDFSPGVLMDYQPAEISGDFTEAVRGALDSPRSLKSNIRPLFDDVFDSRRTVEFDLEEDQFFTMGDNSPQSQDARIWGYNQYVDRQYLLGKALFIYWPHPTGPIYLPNPLNGFRVSPMTPNFERMGFVR